MPMLPKPEVHAYLAGPDVFYPGTFDIRDSKKATAEKHGIVAHYPSDVVVPEVLGGLTSDEARRTYIVEENERLMEECCAKGKIGVIFLNLDAFRGANMDDGTAAEGGYVRALTKHHPNKDNIIIVGYLDKDKRPFKERLADHYTSIGRKFTLTKDETFGLMRDPDGNLVDNTAYVATGIEHTILQSSGRICGSFEEACELAQKLAAQKAEAMQSPVRYKQSRAGSNRTAGS